MLVNSFQQQEAFNKVQYLVLIYFLLTVEIYYQMQKASSPFNDNSFSLTSETTNENSGTELNKSKFADDYHVWRISSNISDLEKVLFSLI